MESRTRASPEQFLALLDFIESHGDISRPQSGPQGRIKQDRLWQELTELLNSTGGGVIKSTEKWKKVWTDWKTKTKKKALVLRRETHCTGGGPSRRQALTDLEQRVLEIVGLSAVVGLTGIEERGFDDQPSESVSLPLNTAERTLNSNEIILETLPGHSTQIIEDMTSDSPSILHPSGVIQSQSTASPPPLAPVPAPAPVSATSPVASTTRGGAQRRGRDRTASPAAVGRDRGLAASVALTASPTASTPRRRALFVRRRRIQTPFERSTSEFVNVENRRLQLEEDRERNLHQREKESFLLESRRLDIEENRNKILADIAIALTTRLLQSSSSLPSTEILPPSSD